MIGDRYYYHRLSEKNQILYRLILNSATNYVSLLRCNIQESYSQNDIMSINNAIVLDNPYLFYYSGNMTVCYNGLNIVQIDLSFDFDQDKCVKLRKELNERTKAFLRAVKLNGKTEEERVRAIHDLLVTKVTYTENSIGSNVTETGDESKFAHNILGVILNKKAVCDGIAKAFKYFLNAVGIGSIIVVGEAKTASKILDTDLMHAWNIVKIEGENYYTDVTWDIVESNYSSICYDYYNLTEYQIRKDHSGFEGFPLCNSLKHNYFFKNDTIMHSEKMLLDFVDCSIRKNARNVYVRLDFVCDFMRVYERLKKRIMESLQYLNRSETVHFFCREEQMIIRVIFG